MEGKSGSTWKGGHWNKGTNLVNSGVVLFEVCVWWLALVGSPAIFFFGVLWCDWLNEVTNSSNKWPLWLHFVVEEVPALRLPTSLCWYALDDSPHSLRNSNFFKGEWTVFYYLKQDKWPHPTSSYSFTYPSRDMTMLCFHPPDEPPTSPRPIPSAGTEHISRGHHQKWYHTLGSLMSGHWLLKS